MNIALIGMAGSGKSYIGTRLAERLGLRFVDIDKVLEEKHGKPLQQILDEMGDAAFMRAEGETLIAATRDMDQLIISPGGSIVYNDEAMRHLKEISKVIYLSVPFSTIEERVGNVPRGIVGLGAKTLRQLYDERISLYEKYADEMIETDGRDIDEIIETITEAVS